MKLHLKSVVVTLSKMRKWKSSKKLEGGTEDDGNDGRSPNGLLLLSNLYVKFTFIILN